MITSFELFFPKNRYFAQKLSHLSLLDYLQPDPYFSVKIGDTFSPMIHCVYSKSRKLRISVYWKYIFHEGR